MEITAEETGRFREGVYKMMCGVYEHDPRRASDAADRVLAILALSSSPSACRPSPVEKAVVAAIERAEKAGRKELSLEKVKAFREASFLDRKAAREALERLGCRISSRRGHNPADTAWVATWKA